MESTAILVIDDEQTIRLAFEKLFEKAGYHVHLAKDGLEGLAAFERVRPPVTILDMRMPGLNGIEVLERIKTLQPDAIVIVVTAHGDMETTIRAMKLGAYDFLHKPFDDNNKILELVAKGLAALRAPATAGPAPAHPGESPDRIVSLSPAMQEVYKLIGRIASTSVTVLVTGESGSGKEMIARAIHDSSGRAARPFVPINCTAIPEHLIESELFGHEKGAFTGAAARRIGKFELADHGTLFLDEIADMPIDMQAKLLRVLQEKEIVRVGGAEQIKVDVRIVAATNRNLEAAIAQGALREDLYHRLKVIHIELPPLRKRKDDILGGEQTPGLVPYFIDLCNREMDKHVTGLSPEARDLILRYDWPGNVRELKNAMESAVAICSDAVITPEHLPIAITKGAGPAMAGPPAAEPPASVPPAAGHPTAAATAHAPAEPGPGCAPEGLESAFDCLRGAIAADLAREIDGAGELSDGDYYDRFIGRVESLLLEAVLRKFNNNQVKTARFLGINRNTLRTKIEKRRPAPPREG